MNVKTKIRNIAEAPRQNGNAHVVQLHRAKRGRPKKNACDEVQLCAQALCLEEMFDSQI